MLCSSSSAARGRLSPHSARAVDKVSLHTDVKDELSAPCEPASCPQQLLVATPAAGAVCPQARIPPAPLTAAGGWRALAPAAGGVARPPGSRGLPRGSCLLMLRGSLWSVLQQRWGWGLKGGVTHEDPKLELKSSWRAVPQNCSQDGAIHYFTGRNLGPDRASDQSEVTQQVVVGLG